MMTAQPTTTPYHALADAIDAFFDAAEIEPEGTPHTKQGIPYGVELSDQWVMDAIMELRCAHRAFAEQRQRLIVHLLALKFGARNGSIDVEEAHIQADEALLAFIGDPAITEAYKSWHKFYA